MAIPTAEDPSSRRPAAGDAAALGPGAGENAPDTPGAGPGREPESGVMAAPGRAAPGEVPPEPEPEAPRHQPAVPVLRATRTGGIWVAVIVAAVMLIFLLIFILQNLTTVTVNLLGFSWSMPLGVAMLFAVIAGAMLVALAGTAQILQLRRFARRAAVAERGAAGAPSGRPTGSHRQP